MPSSSRGDRCVRRASIGAVLVACAGLVLFVVMHASRPHTQLDPGGTALLDPLRAEAIAPEALIARLAIPSDATVADVGAGPGYLTLPLAGAVPDGKVIATDIRADYLGVLEARARAAHLDRIESRVVGSDHPGLSANSIDLVLLCQVDHYLASRTAYFRELATALRERGRIAIVNNARHMAPVVAAASQASLELVDSWQPSPGFFANVYRPSRRNP